METNENTVKAFTSTIALDARMIKQDIMGSLAHAAMLGEYGIITQAEAENIKKALSQIFYDYSENRLELPEDGSAAEVIDNELVRRIGATAKKLNAGRSCADRAALNLRMYVKESIDETAALLKAAALQLGEIAFDSGRLVMPYYTHGSKAAPVSFGHTMMNYGEKFVRDIERLLDVKKRVNLMPLGVGNGAGTLLPISKKRVADLLNFAGVCKNGQDAVSDRDFVIEYLSALSLIMTHIAALSQDFAVWSGAEYGFVQFGDAFVGGCKKNPSKKNPKVASLLSAKTARVNGNLVAALTVVKGGANGNNTLSECLEPLFDGEDTVKEALDILMAMLYEIGLDDVKMTKAANEGFMLSGDLIDYLTEKGVGVDDAEKLAADIIDFCKNNNKRLDTLPYDIYQEFSPLFDTDINAAMRPKNAVRLRRREGDPGEGAVKAAVRALNRRVNKLLPE